MRTPILLIYRLLAYLSSGILLASSFEPTPYIILLCCCSYVMACYHAKTLIQELTLALLWIVVGAYLLNVTSTRPQWDSLSIIEVTSYEGQSLKSYRFQAKGAKGNIVVYSKDSLELGALYAAKLSFMEDKYTEYIERAFLEDYLLVEPPRQPSLRQRLTQRWTDLGFEKKERGFLAAVLLGDRSQLDPDLKSQFKLLGATHILAISGLHVGIINALLSALLFWLPQPYRGVSIVLLLWGYAALTGLSPSVVRATLIFSLYALSLLLRRPQEKLHLIAVSAFISLLLQPTLLFNLSFLMSYTAVTFIVLSLKPLKAFEPKNRLLRYLYYLMGVSLAAQLGVSPISLVVFKQFSYWFLIGSALLIPLMPGLLLLGIFALIGEWAATACQYVLSLLFKGIAWITTGLHPLVEVNGFDTYDALWYYLVVLLLMYLTHKALDQRRSD
jgi:ComEC/Rec2-related protein